MSINQISYGTISLANLTDKQWQITEKILDPNHRKRKYSLRDIMNAIMYLVKTGCQWRMLPKDFPPYNTVFYYFDRWKWEGGTALQAVYCLFAILDTSYPVTDRLYEAVVPSRHTCET
mgnify:CR=1 FL=1